MRRQRSTEIQSYFFASALVHGGLFIVLFLTRTPPRQVPPEALEVFNVSASDLEALEPKLPEIDTADADHQASLTPEQLKALPHDPERLPEHIPSSEAVTKANGQIVELADPARAQQAPEDAKYLSRANHRVDQETAAQDYKLSPEVVAPTYSNESSLAHADAGKVKARLEGEKGAEKGQAGRSDGEKIASLPPKATPQEPLEAIKQEAIKPQPPQPAPKPVAEKPQPTKEPPAELGEILARKETPQLFPTSPALAKLNPMLRPSSLSPDRLNPLTPEARDGDARGSDKRVAMIPDKSRYGTGAGGGDNGSAPATVQQGELKGAPSNDKLRERRGTVTMLNAREFKFFGYMQLVKRQVVFYWDQALQNTGRPREKLTRNEYTTVLHVVIDRKGNLKSVSTVRGCGVKNFDEATVQAFRIAAPFPPPPAGMLVGDEAEMPEFGFSLELGRGQAQYSAIDPRSHVMFPGIVWPQ